MLFILPLTLAVLVRRLDHRAQEVQADQRCPGNEQVRPHVMLRTTVTAQLYE